MPRRTVLLLRDGPLIEPGLRQLDQRALVLGDLALERVLAAIVGHRSEIEADQEAENLVDDEAVERVLGDRHPTTVDHAGLLDALVAAEVLAVVHPEAHRLEMAAAEATDNEASQQVARNRAPRRR